MKKEGNFFGLKCSMSVKIDVRGIPAIRQTKDVQEVSTRFFIRLQRIQNDMSICIPKDSALAECKGSGEESVLSRQCPHESSGL